mmetsp:Transcript_91734/g.182261  ORF Transcript_91734/g.182261 Transcript_91734/m.182261 type:complete len:514 (+) Transcript_91734:37-1578(+)|eukprot:CAMPEP_0172725354 /NCGR_PEP_ID=MMETSP1074-20121228/88170_1 /TAXON_ID=2916 /ORGANISM="Ceratium fusus, Strain PA161109" /LENGTH=513 /DNA_ID=CAMNT_0013552103 /DNA_START=46 /DNA_END=1587 /DNA_ORIENTATION=+
MDARGIDAKRSDVTFDLQCEWMEGALARQVSSPCDAWQALALALEQAALEPITEPILGQAAFGSNVTERQLRETLVNTYMAQDEDEIQEILEAKCADDLSFFSKCNIVEWEQARSYWEWYLSCVLDVDVFGKGYVVRMPLDLVDIQILACLFSAQINVMHLLEPAIKLSPPTCKTPSCIARLLHHRGYWAAVKGPTKPDMEIQPLQGAVVEIGEMLPGLFEHASGSTAFIKNYDEQIDCYMGYINQAVIPLARDQIRQVLFFPTAQTADEGPPSRLKAPWRGIAPQSVEWTLLHEHVRQEGFRRLEAMMQELAGRAASVATMQTPNTASTELSNNAAPIRQRQPTKQPRQNTIHQQLQHCYADRGALKRVPWRGIAHSPKCIIVPGTPSVSFEGQLPVEKRDEVMIKSTSGEIDMCWVLGEKDGLEGWISSDCLLIWTVVQCFEEPKDPRAGTFLPLVIGQNVIVKERYRDEWAGWAFGEEWKEEWRSDEQPRKGVFPLQFVTPHVLSRAEQL